MNQVELSNRLDRIWPSSTNEESVSDSSLTYSRMCGWLVSVGSNVPSMVVGVEPKAPRVSVLTSVISAGPVNALQSADRSRASRMRVSVVAGALTRTISPVSVRSAPSSRTISRTVPGVVAGGSPPSSVSAGPVLLPGKNENAPYRGS